MRSDRLRSDRSDDGRFEHFSSTDFTRSQKTYEDPYSGSSHTRRGKRRNPDPLKFLSIFAPRDPSQYVRARPDLHHHVLLHQIEAHGDQRHAQHQIHGTQYETQLDALDRTGTSSRTGDVAAWHEITEPDGAQRYKTEVRPVEELPVFPFGKQYCTSGYVP